MSDSHGVVGHDLPLRKIVIVKEGNSWNWEHPNCPLFPNEESHKGYPADSYEDAKKGAVTHAQVHRG